jgi:hypothetical protein
MHRTTVWASSLLFLFTLVLILTGCIERKPEQLKRRDSPVSGELISILKDQEASAKTNPSDEVLRQKGIKERQMVYQFLAQSLLVEPADLYHAALVLQSTDTATCRENFMLAYYMAVEATRKGFDSAKVVASNSLDKYLVASGVRQRYGTQYGQDRFGRYFIMPYDTTISDHDRVSNGVPTLDSLKRVIAHLNGEH